MLDKQPTVELEDVEKAAYYHFLERSKLNVEGTPECDWNQAVNQLKLERNL